MNISLSTTKTITTSDGTSFVHRKDAMKHAIKLVQRARLGALSFDVSIAQEYDSEGWSYVQVDDLAAFIAANADAILEALTIKPTRKPRAPKVLSTDTVAGTQA